MFALFLSLLIFLCVFCEAKKKLRDKNKPENQSLQFRHHCKDNGRLFKKAALLKICTLYLLEHIMMYFAQVVTYIEMQCRNCQPEMPV